MNINIHYIVFFNIISTCFCFGQGDNIYFSVASNLNRYHYTVSRNDFKIENGEIFLQLAGRRTNKKTLLLLGFYSVGKSLARSNVVISNVNVTISYEMKDQVYERSTASIESVLALSAGRINPKQFINELIY